jgi:hypothetical protein
MREYEALAGRIAADHAGRVLDWGRGWAKSGAPARPGRRRPRVRLPPPTSPLLARRWSTASRTSRLAFRQTRSRCRSRRGLSTPCFSRGARERAGSGRSACPAPGWAPLRDKAPPTEGATRTPGQAHGPLQPRPARARHAWSPQEAREAATRDGFEVRDLRFANILPLTVDHPLAATLTEPMWVATHLLARVPVLNRLAPNVELDAVRR